MGFVSGEGWHQGQVMVTVYKVFVQNTHTHTHTHTHIEEEILMVLRSRQPRITQDRHTRTLANTQRGRNGVVEAGVAGAHRWSR